MLCRDEGLGRKALAELEKDPGKSGVILFARPYNGFAGEAHMGIPHKLASRGVLVIPLDFLPLENAAKRLMYWGMGQNSQNGPPGQTPSPAFRHIHHQFFMRSGFFYHRILR